MSPEGKKVRKIKAKDNTQTQPQPVTQFQTAQLPPDQLAPVQQQPQQQPQHQQIPQPPQTPAQAPAQAPVYQQPPTPPPTTQQPAPTTTAVAAQTPVYAPPQQPIQQPPVQPGVPMTQPQQVTPQATIAQQPITQPIVEQPAKAKLKAKSKRKEKAKKAAIPPVPKGKGKYSQYRYRTSLLKGTFLPILFMAVSFMMLNSAVYQFQGFFEYNMNIILFGLLLGLVIMIGMPIANAARAKNKPNTGASLNIIAGVVIVLVFIVVNVGIAMFIELALAWQFSMGFFIAALFPALVISLYEIATKGKLYIQEPPEGMEEERKLVFVPS